jgi:hypothetical protein
LKIPQDAETSNAFLWARLLPRARSQFARGSLAVMESILVLYLSAYVRDRTVIASVDWKIVENIDWLFTGT